MCRVQNGAGSCTCDTDYFGNPYEGCRPECITNSDCSSNLACINQKCKDPCPGTCGRNAECQVITHNPICSCYPGYTGDPSRYCSIEQKGNLFYIVCDETCFQLSLIQLPFSDPVAAVNPCRQGSCGPNSQCRVVNDQAVCTCLPEYLGTPPNCRPECVVSSECPLNKACSNRKCVDPCLGRCGSNTRCETINHSPICSCQTGYTGDSFTSCYELPS